MLGDRLIFLPIHEVKAKTIFNSLKPNHKIIGIGGGSGTGKSEISTILQELLYAKNRSSLLLSLDDYYATMFLDRTRIRKRKGIKSVGSQEIDWDFVREIIKAFKKHKETLELQQINKFTNSYYEIIAYNTNKVDYLIIEGLFTGCLRKDKLINYYVHLDGNPNDTLEFRTERKKENEKDKFRQKVVQKENNVVVQLKRYADLVIPWEIKNEKTKKS